MDRCGWFTVLVSKLLGFEKDWEQKKNIFESSMDQDRRKNLHFFDKQLSLKT